MKFTSEIKNKDINYHANGDWSTEGITIEWTIEPEYHKDGINGMNVSIIDVYGEIFNEENNEVIHIAKKDFEIKNDLEINEHGVLFITDILIDLLNDEITIEN